MTMTEKKEASHSQEEQEEEPGYTFHDAVEFIGFGRFHVMLIILCGFGWFAEITELVIMSFVAPQIQQAFDLSPLHYGVLGSISFAGMAIGAISFGMIADRFGRWIGFTLTTAITFIFSLASAFAPSYSALLVFRILATAGVGGTLPIDYTHLVEFLPVRNRGRHMAVVDAIGVIPALFFSSLLAYFFSSDLNEGGGNEWRWILGQSQK
jgi:putative MFS transporter